MIFIGTASSIRQGVLNGDDFAGIYHGKTCVKDMTKKEIKRLHRELKTYRREGIPLLLNGRQTTAKRIEEACQIAETGGYMRDYIQDDQGKLRGLSFDLIKDDSFQLYTK